MKTCADCQHWCCFDSCCWCPSSYNYLVELDRDMQACEEFEPEEIEQEDENEDDA